MYRHGDAPKINEKLGTNYDLFNYYGAPDADRVMIAMGSVCDVADEVIDYLQQSGGHPGTVQALSLIHI